MVKRDVLHSNLHSGTQGYTCLHEAIQCRQEAAVTLMLENGANIDLKITSEVLWCPAKRVCKRAA